MLASGLVGHLLEQPFELQRAVEDLESDEDAGEDRTGQGGRQTMVSMGRRIPLPAYGQLFRRILRE